MSATLVELAERFGCELRGGDAELPISNVGTLLSASSSAISFLANPAYRSQLSTTNAGAVILEERYAQDCPVPVLISSNPYAVYARAAQFLHPRPVPEPGIDSSASVAADAILPKSVRICAQAVVGAGTRIGESVVNGEGSVVGDNVSIGEGTQLAPRVVLIDGVDIGKRCIMHSGVIVGSDGFGFARDQESWVKVPQLGSVVIGDDVEIGANSTIDCGTIEDTSVELWDRMFAVNARAPFLLMQGVIRIMKRDGNGGAIVNVITMSSHGGQPKLTAYCASKGALATLTKNIAHAVRFDGIRVNGLNIGWADTANEHTIQRAEGQPEDWLARAEAEQPFGRLIKPADVARFCLFLLGPESGVMTGSVIDCDQMVMGAYD